MKENERKIGSALVEAIIIAPGLAILLGSTVALHGMYVAKVSAKEHARRLAWLQADSGECPVSSCSSPKCGDSVENIERELLSPRASSGGLSLDSFLGDLSEFFIGRATRGVATAKSKLPGMMPSRETTQRGAVELMCNAKPRTTPDGDSVLQQACRTGLRNAEYAREVCR